ncbi:hypothetical protein ACFWFZ_31855 [Streptomyces sp. NPDC060232]|uniref:hypothetical protein n=1 Tax=Streptomyces sp. NPDC060232 TaxID=3347079 RepID=UPI003667E720
MDEVVRRKVSRVPWGLAVTATAVTAAAAVWSAIVGTGGVLPRAYLVALAVVALPLLTRHAPTAFTCACLLTGMVLLWVSLIGAAFGLAPVAAAALLLLVSSVADPDHPPSGCSVALAAALPPVFFLVASLLAY